MAKPFKLNIEFVNLDNKLHSIWSTQIGLNDDPISYGFWNESIRHIRVRLEPLADHADYSEPCSVVAPPVVAGKHHRWACGRDISHQGRHRYLRKDGRYVTWDAE